MVCAFLFYRRKLKKPIELLEAAYRKVAENDLDFVLRYDSLDEMGKLCEAFEKMRRSLSENNREMWRQMEERKRLNAAFSHDLRTPLTVLKGHASMLLSSLPQHSLPQEEVIGEVRTMAAHITRLEKYVEAMTQLQRLEDIEIRREPVDAAVLIGALEETAGILCGDKTLLSHDTVEGGAFRLDEEAVSQVFENLLSNAVRYAEQKIEITFRTSAQFFCIEVSDDGAGFSCAGLEQATAPFYREKQEFGDLHMGIGLNICKILCIKHGGYLSVANRKEGGACVTAVFAV
ncbi:MAG TPA: HAMP domain-containing histidine kinase [Candidatus Egerieisoma faecipullorum]|uniref:histidine kinase n=1 Tax=Candidatus Egerieisoma faecipullorum TaxID=2840963 RepID=A0A9D1I848_9CLOT|nr:HAMP domain-containing histidine kinase [Candidatus Egerieisoma faecipullorum]